MDRKSPLMSPPLRRWQMVTGTTRSTLTWSTHPGESTTGSWSRSGPRSRFPDRTSDVLNQVWREDLLCRGARQPEDPDD